MRGKFNLVAFLAVVLIAMIFVAISAQAATPKMPDFFARRDYSGVLAPDEVQIGDANGDGIPDVVANSAGNITVLLGNGDGTFRTGPSEKIFYDSSDFVATDLNGDGIVDLMIAGQSTTSGPSGIGVSMGNGDGTFASATFYQTATDTPFNVIVGDFNGDGIPDVVATGGQGVWLLTGRGGGSFNAPVLAATTSGTTAVGDFNGDEKLDLAMISSSGFSILYGNGNGTFQSPVFFTTPSAVRNIAVGSLIKGGPQSIVLSYAKGLYLYFGNGAGKFGGPYPKSVSYIGGINRGAIQIGDVNGDGNPDIVTAGVSILFGNGEGGFSIPHTYVISGNVGPYNATGVALADLANNGRTDIVTGGHDVSVLLNLGKGGLEDGIWTNVTGGAGCGVKGDFNGDGKPDLAVNNANGVSILFGTGKYLTPFTAGTNIALPGAGCLVKGDLNGDGIPDLLVPFNGSPNSVNAYLGKGDGTFTLTSTTPIPNTGGYIAVGDFNHDGKLDFVTSGNLIALGNGDGTFQNPTDIVADPPSTGFSGIAVGDINNDGWPDIVLTNNGIPYNNFFVLLNNHQGGFSQVPATIGALTTQPILADLNGDGNLDLVVLATSSGAAVVLLGNGKGVFTQQVLLTGPIIDTPGLIMVSDVNGDGIPDIGVLAGDTLLLYLGQSGATYASPFGIGTGPSPGSLLTEDLHGQSPKANIPDIVVPDGSGGVDVLLNLTP